MAPHCPVVARGPRPAVQFRPASLVKSPSFGETFRDLAGESLVIPRRILDLMEHVKSEDLAVADVPQQKDPEAGADGLHETLEAL